MSAFTARSDELYGSSSYQDSPRSQDQISRDSSLRKPHSLDESSSYTKFDEVDLKNTDVNIFLHTRNDFIVFNRSYK